MRELLWSIALSWAIADATLHITPLPPLTPAKPAERAPPAPPPVIACDMPKDQSRVASLRPDELLPSRKVRTQSFSAPPTPAPKRKPKK